MPVLIAVVIIKYVILMCRRFKTSKKLFYSNLVGYTLFLLVVILLDYRKEIFGEDCPHFATYEGNRLSYYCMGKYKELVAANLKAAALALKDSTPGL